MKIIAHRGAKGLAPENTLAAFRAGLESRADMIEFDVRTSSDRVLVVNHDPKINKLKIKTTTYSNLKDSKPDLLTFKEVVDFINNRKPLLVEIKKGADINVVIKELEKIALPKGSMIGSFNFPILKAIRKSFPVAELIVIHKWSGVIATHRAKVLETKYIGMNQRWLWKGFIRAVVKSGYKLTPYTINDPRKLKRWSKLNLYGFVTDNPVIF